MKAKELLKKDGEKNISEIAYECGFGSANIFYRAYKKELGKPPKR